MLTQMRAALCTTETRLPTWISCSLRGTLTCTSRTIALNISAGEARQLSLPSTYLHIIISLQAIRLTSAGGNMLEGKISTEFRQIQEEYVVGADTHLTAASCGQGSSFRASSTSPIHSGSIVTSRYKMQVMEPWHFRSSPGCFRR